MRAAAAAGVAVVAAALVIRCAPFGATPPNDSPPHDIDAAPDSEAGSFCAGQDASFCADFDEGLDAAAGFSPYSGEATNFSVTTKTSVSHPGALSVALGPAGGGARMSWHFSTLALRTTLAFDVQVPPSGLQVGDGLTLVELDCVTPTEAGPAFSSVWFGTMVVDSGASETLVVAGDPPSVTPALREGWSHVEIVVQWGVSKSDVRVAFDGAEVRHLPSAPVTCAGAADAFVLVGLQSGGGGEVLYDNVVVDVDL